jgi:hypothetical protein
LPIQRGFSKAKNGKEVGMNTLEILTLLLVIFALLWKAIHNAATNRNHRKDSVRNPLTEIADRH